MIKLILTLFFFVFFAGWAEAQEPSLNKETDEISLSESICPGNWVLSNTSGWIVRNEAGQILPLSARTIVLGCDGEPTSLYEDLSGSSVGIECTPADLKNGIPNVQTVKIWCK